VNSFAANGITAAILAGGAGSRLGGSDKGLETLAGKAIVAHVIDAIRPQVGSIVLCVNRNRDQYAAFAPTCIDGTPGYRGPLAGIAAAAAMCATPWLLTLPVDSPRPPADLALRLLGAAEKADVSVAVAHDGKRRQPLFALYSADSAARAQSALARDLAVWRWQDECGAVDVDFSDQAVAFVNLNMADDFRRWEADHHA
jgi:molybdenum cofactor guanylyltransferase